MSDYYISIDQGTTSTRCFLYQSNGELLAETNHLIQSIYPNTSWVEQNPTAIIESVEMALKQVINKAKISAKNVKAIGITNQRETTVLWDKANGQAIYPAIVWQDRRTAQFYNRFKHDVEVKRMIHHKTGLVLDPYFSATKIAWILEQVPNSKALLESDQLLFGTIDTFLLWHLTDGKVHATDITNASRTLLFNIRSLQWDEELLSFFKIPPSILPSVHASCYPFGCLSKRVLGVEIPITAMIGDQQSASIGQGCIAPHQIKATYGTGCFMLLNTGEACIYSNHQLLTTIAYQINGKTTYALEGSIFIAGALIKWLKNSLKFFQTESQIEQLIAASNQQDETLFVPALSGLGAPFWDPHAKGAIFGLTQDTSIGHILKAGIEGICFQTKDLIESLKLDYHHPLASIKVDGGMSVNHWFLQTMANTLNIDILKPASVEATAYGAFLLAGIGSGLFQDLNEAVSLTQIQQHFKPNTNYEMTQKKYRNWLKHIDKVRESHSV